MPTLASSKPPQIGGNKPVLPSSKPPQATNRDPLIAGYEELNALWKQAEEQLAAMRVSARVEVPLPLKRFGGGTPDDPEWEKTDFLSWCKPDNEWRLSLSTVHRDLVHNCEDGWSARPVAECPMEDRIALAKHFPALKVAMEEARQKMIPVVADAIATLKKAVSK